MSHGRILRSFKVEEDLKKSDGDEKRAKRWKIISQVRRVAHCVLRSLL